ncbi:MAG: response regulator [Sandaracinus sp.]|nr:response regulator [Sandaracinus sp.]
MAQKSGTALGVARSRFVDGLPRKSQELKGAIALLVATPSAPRPREELRRRLHALYASAQVFRLETLATALKEAIQRLDAAREGGVDQEGLDALSLLAATLPALGAKGEEERASVYPAGPSYPTGPRASAPGEAPEPEAAPLPVPRPASTATPRGRLPSAPKLPAMRPAEPAAPAKPLFPATASPAVIAPAMSASASGMGRLPARPDAPLDTVVSVLVIDAADVQSAVREALPTERYELFGATDPEAGLRLARTVAPDVVLLDAQALVAAPDLVVRLHADAATELVPVGVLLDERAPLDEEELRARGVDALLHKPATSSGIRRLVDRLAIRERSGPTSDVLGEATVEEVADRLSREIRRGLVEAAATGRDERIELGDGSELLAAAWATIARVRAELADRSHGKLRFRDGARRGGPAFMALAGDEDDDRGSDDVSLEGRRVVVADDDPAVVWFFAGLLREAGAVAIECEDGREALDEARRKRPDVIVSDILMPRLDGLALCRELKRDPGLADVPVILLSWKEDFLQRMRELQSGASGYLRKEAGSGQILSKLREVLRPRARLESRLRAGGEVRGRIEAVGVRALLQSAAESRRDARVTLRDAWSLFEVDVREGQIVDVTRTATDGSFSRGERALPALLGVSTGRFTVDDADGPARPSLRGDSEAVLRDAAEQLGAHVDAVSGSNLARVARVRFDELLLQAFLRTSLGDTRLLVERVATGESPRDLLVEGKVSPVVLETALVDLARRGAVTSVRDDDGEDLVQAALEARRTHAAKPSVPPRPRDESTGATASKTEPSAATATDADVASEPAASEPGASASATSDSSASEPPEALLEAPTNAPPTAPAAVVTETEPEEVEELLHAPTNPPPEPPSASRRSSPGSVVAEAAPEKPKPSSSPQRDSDEPDSNEPEPTEVSARPAIVSRPAETPPAESGGMGLGGWALLVILFGVAGYFGWRALREPERGAPDPRASDGPAPVVTEAPSPEPAPTEAASPETPEEPEEPEETEASELSFGRTLPSIETDLEVAEGQGLLQVEAAEGEVEVALRRRGEERLRELGGPPVSLPLDEGQYEIVFRSSAGETVRFLFVRAGQTRVVRPDR